MGGFNLSRWAIEHGPFTRFLIVLLLLCGVYAYLHLGQKEDPEFTFRTMVVQAYWPGATAREMEQQVTDVLEKKLQETPYLDFTRSYSKPGETTILVNLRQDTPPHAVTGVWYQVRKKIGDIRSQLPAGVQGPVFNDEFGDTYIAMYAFTADGYTPAELKDYADRARDRLLGVSGVRKVDLLGEQADRIYVQFSYRKFAELGITLQQLSDAVQGQNQVTPAGVAETGRQQVPVRISGDYHALAALRDLKLRADGDDLRLKDFATVTRGVEDPPTYKIRWHGHDALLLGVVMDPHADVLQVGKRLHARVAEIQANDPVGIEIHQVTDQGKVVEEAVGEFLRSLVEAVSIVLIVSFLSLGLRTGLVVALTIPLVLAVTFLVMWECDIALQKISLGALVLALGLLVDDAMIAVEMMARKLEEGLDRLSAASFAFTSTAFPMLTGTLITAAGFLPIGLAKSAAGEYTFTLFAVVGIALLVSWFGSVYFTPYIGYVLLKEHAHPGEAHDLYQTRFYRKLRGVIDSCVRYRKTTIAVTLLAFVLGLASFALIPQQFFPNSNRNELMVDLWLPEGTSFAATEAVTRQLEGDLAKQADAADYIAYVGGGSPRFYLPLDQELRYTNFAQFMVEAKDLDARERLLKWLRADLAANYPGVRSKVARLNNGPPVGWPLQFRVRGPNDATVRQIADRVEAVVRADAQTLNVHDDWHESIPTLHLHVDQAKLRLYGITSTDVRRAGETILSGMQIGNYRVGNRNIPVIARQPLDERNSIAGLRDAYMPIANGKSVPFAQLGQARFVFEPGIIWRRNRLPTITVQAEVAEGLQSPDVEARIDRELDSIRAGLPAGYSIEPGGALEESAIAQHSINVSMPLLVVIILLLLMIQLQHFGRSMLVFLTAPLGIIGAALALLVFQAPFGFVALMGVIALSGMIMRNSVILVDQIEQDIRGGASRWDAIVESTVRRFRPIMLTAAAAVLAMIPLSRSVFFGPMAIALMGGLVVATLLTLTFLPAAYAAGFRVQRVANAPAHR